MCSVPHGERKFLIGSKITVNSCFMATTKKPAAPAADAPKKPKPRKLSDAQLAARIGRDSAELAKRATAAKAKTKTKGAAKK
jgi:hypothetical protein